MIVDFIGADDGCQPYERLGYGSAITSNYKNSQIISRL